MIRPRPILLSVLLPFLFSDLADAREPVQLVRPDGLAANLAIMKG
jgi:hypothetical protein